ncbi:MAG: hypothetical protein E7774_10025 [Bradyrhizobium sp.]|nr:MAG: hypothetical protein E7774_10025 [Bradyrhizobium sp.]
MIIDENGVTPTTTRTFYTLTELPNDIYVEWGGTVSVETTSQDCNITDPDEPATTAVQYRSDVTNHASGSMSSRERITSNQTIGVQCASTSFAINLMTWGFKDFRRS